jgi:hypothetical protein
MTTEYYQIPSQQGLLPLDSADPDPWLAAAANSLSLSDWSSVKGKLHTPPSLFEPDDADAVSWKHVVPMQHPAGTTKPEIKAPKVPKQFHSTSSKIDAWSVVDSSVLAAKQKKQPKQQKPSAPVVVVPPVTAVEEDPKATIEDELAHQNISFI